MWAVTTWPVFSLTRKAVLGRVSTTSPSNGIASSFDMRPCCARGWDKPGALCIKHPGNAILRSRSAPAAARRTAGVAGQQRHELLSRDLPGAEARQVGTGDLAVDQADVAAAALLDQAGHGHLRGVALPAEHRFAEKYAAQLDAVKTADQALADSRFNGVGKAEAVQALVGIDHFLMQPGVRSRSTRLRAGADGGCEVAVQAGGEGAVAKRFAQAAGDHEFLGK